MRPLLLVVLTGRKSLNQEMSGSGLPLAAQSMVAVRVRSTTFNCGPMSMVGKPGGSWSSGDKTRDIVAEVRFRRVSGPPQTLCRAGEEGVPVEIIVRRLRSNRMSERKQTVERR